ncbi:hypothetical protein [Streptomyces sp. NPDC046909]|uniref:hypothetical protein n=1 Tax=Streptomyces sp. NPDC046909 TaxID=3155617 RepID=UPI0033C610B1
MIEMVILRAVMVVFKAAFAGEDLDRKVGAQAISTIFDGLLKTTSTSDPVLQQIQADVKHLTTAPYEAAMAAGHRYLEEARLATETRVERLRLAREQLVAAASAAEGLKMPMLIANAEFAVAKCDALLGSAAHAGMALRRASSALEGAIERLDIAGYRSRLYGLEVGKHKQDESLSNWLTELTSGSLVKKKDIEAAERTLEGARASLAGMTDLYSEVQTAALCAGGREGVVVWESDATYKAVATVRGTAPVCGFGVTLCVERQIVWRSGSQLLVDLLLQLTTTEDREIHCSTWTATTEPMRVADDADTQRLADPTPPLLSFPARTFLLPKGNYRGWLRVEPRGNHVERVDLEINRFEGDRRVCGGGIRIPIAEVAEPPWWQLQRPR